MNARQTMWERVREITRGRTLTYEDYRLIDQYLTRPLTWEPIRLRRARRQRRL